MKLDQCWSFLFLVLASKEATLFINKPIRLTLINSRFWTPILDIMIFFYCAEKLVYENSFFFFGYLCLEYYFIFYQADLIVQTASVFTFITTPIAMKHSTKWSRKDATKSVSPSPSPWLPHFSNAPDRRIHWVPFPWAAVITKCASNAWAMLHASVVDDVNLISSITSPDLHKLLRDNRCRVPLLGSLRTQLLHRAT